MNRKKITWHRVNSSHAQISNSKQRISKCLHINVQPEHEIPNCRNNIRFELPWDSGMNHTDKPVHQIHDLMLKPILENPPVITSTVQGGLESFSMLS